MFGVADTLKEKVFFEDLPSECGGYGKIPYLWVKLPNDGRAYQWVSSRACGALQRYVLPTLFPPSILQGREEYRDVFSLDVGLGLDRKVFSSATLQKNGSGADFCIR